MWFLSSLLSACLMCSAAWLLTRREGTTNLKPFLLISLAAGLFAYLAFRVLGLWGIPLACGGLVFALARWCYLTIPQACLLAGLWLLSQIAFGLLISPIF